MLLNQSPSANSSLEEVLPKSLTMAREAPGGKNAAKISSIINDKPTSNPKIKEKKLIVKDYETNKENFQPLSSKKEVKSVLSRSNNKGAGGSSEKADIICKAGSKKQNCRKPSSCVFVASLPALLTDDELCRSVSDHFQVFGDLASVKVLRDPSNRPYAFVQYTNDNDCQTAIELGHDSELGGRRLRCEPAKVNRTLFFSFPAAVKQDEIEKIVKEFGEADLVSPGTESGRLIGNQALDEYFNWFVKFAYREEAIQAFASLADSTSFQVEWAQNVDDCPGIQSNFDKASIFVGQLPKETTIKLLEEHFSVHGEVENVSIVRRPESTFAFITFKDEFAAASAVARDNHALFMNKTIHVKYKLSAPRKSARVILSARVPVALAPPPIHPRNRYPDMYSNQPSKLSVKRSEVDARKQEVFSSSKSGKQIGYERYYLIPTSK